MKNAKYIFIAIFFGLFLLMINSCTKHTIFIATVDNEHCLKRNLDSYFQEIWKDENLAEHLNIEAKKEIDKVIDGRELKLSYTGKSYIEKNNTFITDDYICENNNGESYKVSINSDTGEWIKYSYENKSIANKDRKPIKLEEAHLLAHNYAKSIVQNTFYNRIEVEKYTGKYIFYCYAGDRIEILKIVLFSDGELNSIEKIPAKQIKFLSSKSSYEIEDAYNECCGENISKEIKKLMNQKLKDNFILKDITYISSNMIFDNKIARLYECTVYVVDKATGIEESFHSDVIVYSENEGNLFNPFRKFILCD